MSMVSVSLLAGPEQEGHEVFLQSSLIKGLLPFTDVQSSLGSSTGRSSILECDVEENVEEREY